MKFIPTRRALLYTPPVAAAGALGLQTSLTGFWSMENTSWLDDTASATTLTATGSPTSSNTAPAIVGNYVSLDGSSALTAASNSNIVTAAGSFSVQAWIYCSTGATGLIIGKAGNGFGNQEWELGTRFNGSANKWCFVHWDSSSTSTNCDTATSIPSSTWAHLVATWNSGTKVATLYLNGSSDGTATPENAINSTSQSFKIGLNRDGATFTPATTRIDQCGFWKGRILSAGDVTALYNSGAGLSYAAMA